MTSAFAETAARYTHFAEHEAQGRSPLYEVLSRGVADDADVLALLDGVPEPKRQPNLLFAAAMYLGGAQPDYPTFRQFVLEHRDEVEALLLTHSTQTNEAGRCSVLLPALGLIPGPLALLEVGASAGLCLLPDRYGYDYGEGRRLGVLDSAVQLTCRTIGPVPLPERMPEVVWRAGLDLAPVDVRDDDAVRWLEACVWPDQPHRLARLRAAVSVAREDPPRVVAGDLLEATAALAAEAPRDATLVIFHTTVLMYVAPEDRARFAATVAGIDAVWLSNEAEGVFPSLDGLMPRLELPGTIPMLLGRNGSEVLAVSDPHGTWLAWPD